MDGGIRSGKANREARAAAEYKNVLLLDIYNVTQSHTCGIVHQRTVMPKLFSPGLSDRCSVQTVPSPATGLP